jgi:hypothetical protein
VIVDNPVPEITELPPCPAVIGSPKTPLPPEPTIIE